MSTQQEQYDDEISISEIFYKLWRRRGLILFLPVLSGILGIMVVLAMATQASTPIIHYVSLTGIEKGKYPNGVAFSPMDMRAQVVLNELASRMGMENDEAFSEAIVVTLGAPSTQGILKKYTDRLSQKGLNAAEIDTINAELDEELKRTTESTALIAIDYQPLGITKDQAAQMATLLPQVWAEVFTKKFRVLDNTKLSGFSREETLSLQTPSASLEANDHIIIMLDALAILEQDSRLSGLQTQAGITPADLRVRVDNFNNLYLSAILSRNLRSADGLTENYQSELVLKINKINEQIEGIEDAISSIQDVISGDRSMVATSQGLSGERMQVTGDAIGDIVSLVNKSSLSEYLTTLYQQKIKFIAQRSDLNLRLNKITEKLVFGEDLINFAEARLNQLNADYTILLEMARKLNRENNATLSQSLGSPFSSGSILPKRGILIIMLSIFVGGFIAACAALVMPSRAPK